MEEENMGCMETGEKWEEIAFLQFPKITQDHGASLAPPSLAPLLAAVRRLCLKSRRFGRQVDSSGLKTNKGRDVLWPNRRGGDV